MIKSANQNFWLDPRTKLLLLLICVITAMISPSLGYNCGLVALIMALGIASGRARSVLLGTIGYMVLVALSLYALNAEPGTMITTMLAFLGLLHKIFPCSMLSGVIVPTTKVSEFLSSMNRIHAPKKLVIPLAVMIRYVPTIQEDWRFIKDAMNMRDVSPSFRGFLTKPVITTECVYVPLMMAASKAADELSIASVTRGIENPNPRTCLVQIRFGILDYLVLTVFSAYFIFGCFL